MRYNLCLEFLSVLYDYLSLKCIYFNMNVTLYLYGNESIQNKLYVLSCYELVEKFIIFYHIF